MAKKSKPKQTPEEVAACMLSRLDAFADLAPDIAKCETRPMPTAGIYLPHLCLRRLFRLRVIPFSRFIEIYGAKRSCKSGFLFYLYKLFVDQNGLYMHLPTEDKDSPELRMSILGWPTQFSDARRTFRVSSMDGYMRLTKSNIENVKKVSDQVGAGRSTPFIVGVDSLTAKLLEDTQGKIEERNGVPFKRFPDEAKVLNDWFRWMTELTYGWPFLVVGINHDQPKKEEGQFQVTHHTPGGVLQGYAATLMIRMTHTHDVKATADGTAGHEVELRIDKGSLAPTGTRIKAVMRWREEMNPDGLSFRQRTWWDWDAATVETLHHFVTEVKGDAGRQVDDILGLRRQSGGRWSCRALGIKPDDAVPASEMGAAIDANQDLTAQLDPLLGVHSGVAFAPGMDLEDLLGEGHYVGG